MLTFCIFFPNWSLNMFVYCRSGPPYHSEHAGVTREVIRLNCVGMSGMSGVVLNMIGAMGMVIDSITDRTTAV